MRDDKRREAARAAEERLDLLPRGVRDKLDGVGLKLHLAEWQALSMPERERLRDLPCQTADEAAQYAAEIERLVRRISGKSPDRLKAKDQRPAVRAGQGSKPRTEP